MTSTRISYKNSSTSL